MEGSRTSLQVVVSVFVRGALLVPAPAAADVQFVGVRDAFDAGDDGEGAGSYLSQSDRPVLGRSAARARGPQRSSRRRGSISCDPDRVTPPYDKEQIR